MFFSRPRFILALAFAALLGSIKPSRLGGFREPLASRLTQPPACEQQWVQELDFGVMRWKGSRRKPRC